MVPQLIALPNMQGSDLLLESFNMLLLLLLASPQLP
jgi:hypothetical protein